MLSSQARVVLEHLAKTGRGIWVDEAISMPNGDAQRDLSSATGMPVEGVVAGLAELSRKRLLEDLTVRFSGIRAFRMLAPNRRLRPRRRVE